MRDPDGLGAPDIGHESEVSASEEPDEEPEALYRPLLSAEAREELRREWLADLPPAGRRQHGGRAKRSPRPPMRPRAERRDHHRGIEAISVAAGG